MGYTLRDAGEKMTPKTRRQKNGAAFGGWSEYSGGERARAGLHMTKNWAERENQGMRLQGEETGAEVETVSVASSFSLGR